MTVIVKRMLEGEFLRRKEVEHYRKNYCMQKLLGTERNRKEKRRMGTMIMPLEDNEFEN